MKSKTPKHACFSKVRYHYLLVGIWLMILAGSAMAKMTIPEMEAQLEHLEGKERVSLLIKLASRCLETAPEKAIAIANEVLEQPASVTSPKEIFEAYKTIGVAYTYTGNYAEADRFTQKSLELAEEEGSSSLIAAALINLGIIYRYQSAYEKSIRCYQRAIRVLDKEKQTSMGALAVNEIGITYYFLGDYENALENYMKALKIRRELEDTAGVADSMNNIAMIYDEMRQYEKAMESYEKSLSVFEQLGDRRGLVNPLTNLGLLYSEYHHDYERAEEFHRRALQLRRELKDRYGEASSLNNLGTIYSEKGDLETSLDYYHQALTIKQELGDKGEIADTLRDIGAIYRQRGELDKALTYVQESRQILEEINSKNDMKAAYSDLSEIFEVKGDYQQALMHYKKFHAIENEIRGEQTAESISEITNRYQVEKKEQEIALLRKESRFQRKIQYFFILSLVLIFLFFLAMINRYRLNTRANRLLLEKKQEIEDQRTRLASLNAVLESKSQEYYITSITDTLTATYNKAAILDTLSKSFSICKRNNQPLSCVFIDLDHFKRINDTCGHLVGDKVLKKVSRSIMEANRREDSLGRYGGDEFLLIMPNTNLDGAWRVAEKMRTGIERVDFSEIQSSLIVTISAGIAEVMIHYAQSTEELLKQADIALYEAKRTGRNRSMIYSEKFVH